LNPLGRQLAEARAEIRRDEDRPRTASVVSGIDVTWALKKQLWKVRVQL